MTKLEHDHNDAMIVDVVDDPVATDANAKRPTAAGHLAASGRARIVSKCLNDPENADLLDSRELSQLLLGCS